MADRIGFMAKIRNAAMFPLLQVSVPTERDFVPVVNGTSSAASLVISSATPSSTTTIINSPPVFPTRPSQAQAEQMALSLPELAEWIREMATEVVTTYDGRAPSELTTDVAKMKDSSSSSDAKSDTHSKPAISPILGELPSSKPHPLSTWANKHADQVTIMFINDVFFSVPLCFLLSSTSSSVCLSLFRIHLVSSFLSALFLSFQLSDALRLLSTNEGQYDMVCSFDYDLVKLYDIWVARDMHVRP